MRISDWSSDVCSSDLHVSGHVERGYAAGGEGAVDGSAGRGRDRLRGAHAVGVRREGRSEIDRADVRPGASGGQGDPEVRAGGAGAELVELDEDARAGRKRGLAEIGDRRFAGAERAGAVTRPVTVGPETMDRNTR